MLAKTQYGNGKKEWEDMKAFVEKNKIHNIFVAAECSNGERLLKIFAHGSTESIKGIVQSWLDTVERESFLRRQTEEAIKLHNLVLQDHKKLIAGQNKNA